MGSIFTAFQISMDAMYFMQTSKMNLRIEMFLYEENENMKQQLMNKARHKLLNEHFIINYLKGLMALYENNRKIV